MSQSSQTLATATYCRNPVFIIGSPRSGTSVLSWAVAASGEFWTSSESDFLVHLFRRRHAEESYRLSVEHPEHRGWLIEQKVSAEEYFEHVGIGLNALFTSRSAGRRWVDATPSYTLVAPTLASLFPGAFFIHALRDGRRVVHSMLNFLKHWSDESRARFASEVQWISDFREACRAWAFYAEASIRFGNLFPSRTFVLFNEELVADPDEVFSRLLYFLEAEPSSAPADYIRNNRINSSFAGQGAPPANPWDTWAPEQMDIFREETANVFSEFDEELLERTKALWPDFDTWYGEAAARSTKQTGANNIAPTP